MLEYQFKPIQQWPGKLMPHYKRQCSRFDSTYSATLELLNRELYHLRAKQIVIQADLKDRDIRNDGMIRADSSPGHPGIILSFQSAQGAMSFPCDTFTNWQDNLRAIALALEALRKVDRVGVTRNNEQYRGWKQLPNLLITPPPMTAEEAAELLCSKCGGGPIRDRKQILFDQEYARRIYRLAAANTHPDKTGGSDADFKRVQEARNVLKSDNPGMIPPDNTLDARNMILQACRASYFGQADATRLPLADRSVDLVFGSPPYCDARTYGIRMSECQKGVRRIAELRGLFAEVPNG